MAAYDAAGNNSASSSKAVASTIAGVTPGLVAYYSFNEASGASLHDYSGNGNNGAITGATWSSSGKKASGLQKFTLRAAFALAGCLLIGWNSPLAKAPLPPRYNLVSDTLPQLHG